MNMYLFTPLMSIDSYLSSQWLCQNQHISRLCLIWPTQTAAYNRCHYHKCRLDWSTHVSGCRYIITTWWVCVHSYSHYEIRFFANTSGHSTNYEPWVDYWLTAIARTTSFITEVCPREKCKLCMNIHIQHDLIYHQSPLWQEVWPHPSAFEWDDCSHLVASACCHSHSHPSHKDHSAHSHMQSCPITYKKSYRSASGYEHWNSM